MDLQGIINAMNDMGQKTRSQYQMTLGRLAEELRASPPDALVRFEDGRGVGSFDSYRGYYCDIAAEDEDEPRTVKAVLDDVESAIGAEMTGYKGGEYVMEEDTPVWRSEYGTASGIAFMGVRMEDKGIIIETRQID